MHYSKEVINYFFNIQHAGMLDEKNMNVCYGEMGSTFQGYLCRLYLYLKKNKVREAKFQVYGSPITTAACEYACRWGEGKTLEEAKQLNADQIKNALDLSSFNFHVAVLIEALWKKTIFKENNGFSSKDLELLATNLY